MKYSSEDNVLTLNLTGRVDSVNASALETEIESIRKAAGAENVILDLEELAYISSAGLRMVLRLRREVPTLKIINVSSEVYDIFEMTGFTEILTVEKAYRKLSIEGCKFLGSGSNGSVYRLDPETIIKVYENPDALPDIRRERELARKAFVLGIPTAIPYDVAKVGDRYGSVFELLNARPLSEHINEEPENFEKYARIYVDLLKKLHSTVISSDDLTDMREVALNWALFLENHLPEAVFEKLTALIKAVPEEKYVLHGDCHIKNIMLQDDEALFIDMDTLCVGDPVFEFGSVFLACIGFTELSDEKFNAFLGVSNDVAAKLWETTLKMYFRDKSAEAVRRNADRARVIGYTRLMRRTIRRIGYDDPEGRLIIENCKKNLIELLRNIDSLRFE